MKIKQVKEIGYRELSNRTDMGERIEKTSLLEIKRKSELPSVEE